MTAENKHVPDGAAAPELPDDSAGCRLAERIAYHMLALKAEDVVVLDLRGLSDVCDFFVLGSGRADVQVKAIARAVRDGLAADRQKPVGTEGESDGRWVLLDYVDVVVHVLKPAVRQYYQLERLWGDARTLPIDADYLDGRIFRRHHPDLAPPAPAE
jgi:ribosome-associated protein